MNNQSLTLVLRRALPAPEAQDMSEVQVHYGHSHARVPKISLQPVFRWTEGEALGGLGLTTSLARQEAILDRIVKLSSCGRVVNFKW